MMVLSRSEGTNEKKIQKNPLISATDVIVNFLITGFFIFLEHCESADDV